MRHPQNTPINPHQVASPRKRIKPLSTRDPSEYIAKSSRPRCTQINHRLRDKRQKESLGARRTLKIGERPVRMRARDSGWARTR